MGRPKGTRNPRYEATREALLERLATRLARAGGARASLRELAAVAEVSLPTLRHYFRSREGVIAAVLERARRLGEPYLQAVASGPLSTLRESLTWFVGFAHAGLVESELGGLHELGLAAGFRDCLLGPAYLDHLLEPTLQALEARLARHVAAGDIEPCDLRLAAIELLAPVLVAVLHQHPLGGARCRPLSLDAFLEQHVEVFLRAYEVPRVVPPRRSRLVAPPRPEVTPPARRPRSAGRTARDRPRGR